MVHRLADLAIAAILALFVYLLGGCALPPGLRLGAGFTGSPLGVQFTMEQASTVTAGTPAAWVLNPNAPATAPATSTAPAP